MTATPLLLVIGKALLGLAAATADTADRAEPVTASASKERNKRSTRPRILFNSDGGTGALYHFKPPITPKQLCRVLNELEGTHVDVFIQSVNHGNDQFLYPTKVGVLYGANIKDSEYKEKVFRRWALNVRSLLDAGHDPLHVWAKRAHALGMQFWPSMRMNDIHCDWVERWPTLRSAWEKRHPEMLIGDAAPDRYVELYKRKTTWAHDFAKQAVRDRKFALIEEMCVTYDVDGFELDFQRHPYYFKKGQEPDGMPLMTQFVRRVRNRLNEIQKRKGRRLVLHARVPPMFAMCHEVGLDVRTWIRQGLVDIVTPMCTGYLDMNADVRGFVQVARETDCRIAGGLEHYVKGYGSGRATIEMMRAASSGYFNEGASAVYLFNYDAHGHVPFKPHEIQTLREIGEPEATARKNKHYLVSVDMRGRTPEEGGTKQLPVDLMPGAERCFYLTIGDDLTQARRDGLLGSVCLRLSLKGYQSSAHVIGVRLNGQAVQQGHVKKNALVFPNVPARQGQNALDVSMTGRDGGRPPQIRIQGIELIVEYGKRAKP